MREYDAEWRGVPDATGFFQAKHASWLRNVKMLCLCRYHHQAFKKRMVKKSKAS